MPITDTHTLSTTTARDPLMLNQKLKPLLTQVPGMDMVDMDMDVVTMVVTTDILTHTDTDTTVERELLMLNQKPKLPLIQVPGTDMVVTMVTHTDIVDTMEVTHTDTEDTTADSDTTDKS